MFGQMKLWDTINATSSPESGSGPTLYDKQGGQTTAKCGPDPAHVNLSARQAKELGLLTSGTYGRPFTGSSASADLTYYLANKLVVKTAKLGSTLYQLTWRERDTPAGRSLPQLVASARPTCEVVYTGWPTPIASQRGGSAESNLKRKEKWGISPTLTDLRLVAQLTDFGQEPTGSTAATESKGRLNPTLPRWLLGLSIEWESCADLVTPSSRPRRKRS